MDQPEHDIFRMTPDEPMDQTPDEHDNALRLQAALACIEAAHAEATADLRARNDRLQATILFLTETNVITLDAEEYAQLVAAARAEGAAAERAKDDACEPCPHVLHAYLAQWDCFECCRARLTLLEQERHDPG